MELITAYWLVGSDSPYHFGSYFDWKTDTENILWHLEKIIETKKYQLNLANILFSGAEQPHEALQIIGNFFKEQGFTLTCWDTESDSYHLYIIQEKDYQSLKIFGEELNIRFYDFN